MVVGILGGHRLRLGVGEILDPLVRLEVVLDPELLAGGVDPHEGVTAVAVHVPPGPGCSPVGHEERHLVRGLGRERPEVPLHVVVAQMGVGAALLGVDEIGELGWVADEEDRRVVAHEVVVALVRVELDREAAGVPHGVGGPELTGDRREPDEHVGRDVLLEDLGPRVLAHVVEAFEDAEGAAALGVDDRARAHAPG